MAKQPWEEDYDTGAAVDPWDEEYEAAVEPNWFMRRLKQAGLNAPSAEDQKGFIETQMPGVVKSASEDLGRVGLDALTLGIPAYLTGEQEKTKQARERLGPLAAPLEFASSIRTPTGVPQKIGRGLQIVGHGVSGGAQSVADAWTHGERDIGDLAWAGVTGSGLSALGSSIADVASSWKQRRQQAAALPDEAKMKAGYKEKYKEVEQAGGVYHRDDVRQLMADFDAIPLQSGLDDRAIAMRKWLKKNYQGKDIPPEKLDQLRRVVRQKMARTANMSDKLTGEQFVEGMDKFTKRVPVVSKTGGDIPMVNENLREARSRYSQAVKSKEVAKAAPREKGWFNVFGEGSEAPSRTRFEKLNTNAYTQKEKDIVDRITGGSFIRDIGEGARQISPFRNPIATGTAVLSGLAEPTSALVGSLGVEGIAQAGKMATKAEIDNLQSIIKTGQSLAADPKVTAAAKDRLAQIMSGTTRTGYRNLGGEY